MFEMVKIYVHLMIKQNRDEDSQTYSIPLSSLSR